MFNRCGMSECFQSEAEVKIKSLFTTEAQRSQRKNQFLVSRATGASNYF